MYVFLLPLRFSSFKYPRSSFSRLIIYSWIVAQIAFTVVWSVPHTRRAKWEDHFQNFLLRKISVITYKPTICGKISILPDTSSVHARPENTRNIFFDETLCESKECSFGKYELWCMWIIPYSLLKWSKLRRKWCHQITLSPYNMCRGALRNAMQHRIPFQCTKKVFCGHHLIPRRKCNWGYPE